MDKISSTLTLLFQIFLAFIVLFGIYIVYALLDLLEIDAIAAIGFLLFQPVFGCLLTALTIFVCLLAGLPIRLIPVLRNAWLAKPFLPLLGAITGIVLLLLALNSHFTEWKEVTIDTRMVQKEVPNGGMALTGWFLTGFSLLHFYPQAILRLLRKRNRVFP